MTEVRLAAAPALRAYQLSDNLAAQSGQVFLTGTQALVRLLLAQKAQDERQGLKTAGFVSGYRGSPLGMVDQQLWKAKKFLEKAQVNFLPAINEDLAATACLGVQRVAGNDGSQAWCTFSHPSRFFSYRRDGVTGRMAACIGLLDAAGPTG